MRIDVRGGELRPSATLRAMAARRVLIVMSRFGRQVRKVTVQLTQAANPLGGVDQRCRMRASLCATDDIYSEAINGSIEASMARAAARLAMAVAWALEGAGGDGRPATPSGLLHLRSGPASVPGPQRQPPGRRRRRPQVGRNGPDATPTRGTRGKRRRP